MLKKGIFILGLLLILCGIGICGYNYLLSPIDSNNKKEIEIEIPNGSSQSSIATILKKNNLIRSKKFFIFYLKMNKINDLKASKYILNKSMNMKYIIKLMREGTGYNPDEITLTFKEGKNIRSVANIISENTNNTYDDVINKLNDKEYINSLIEKYWFLSDEIKNTDLYYPLEGYLYPDTYRFINKDVKVTEIFDKLLDQTDKVLTEYKDVIKKSNMSVHEILTLASIVELEGKKKDDKKDIASVFFNRLDINMSLGSDVTACYAQKIDDTALCHNTADFNYNSKYNTRRLDNTGIPIGPISNPGIDSIDAVISPNKTDYLYFVADKNANIYFFKTQDEFYTKINELKKNGDWL